MWKGVGLWEGGVAARVCPGTRAVWASCVDQGLGVGFAHEELLRRPRRRLARVRGERGVPDWHGPGLRLQSQRLVS